MLESQHVYSSSLRSPNSCFLRKTNSDKVPSQLGSLAGAAVPVARPGCANESGFGDTGLADGLPEGEPLVHKFQGQLTVLLGVRLRPPILADVSALRPGTLPRPWKGNKQMYLWLRGAVFCCPEYKGNTHTHIHKCLQLGLAYF